MARIVIILSLYLLLKVDALLPPTYQLSICTMQNSGTATASSNVKVTLNDQVTRIPLPCPPTMTTAPAPSQVSTGNLESLTIGSPGDVPRSWLTHGSIHQTQTVKSLSGGVSGEGFSSGPLLWSSRGPVLYPSWSFKWRGSMSSSQKQAPSGSTANLPSGTLPVPTSQYVGLTPGAASITSQTNSPPLIPVQSLLSRLHGTGLLGGPSSSISGLLSSLQAHSDTSQTNGDSQVAYTTQELPLSISSLDLAYQPATRTSAVGGQQISSAIAEAITARPSQTSEALFIPVLMSGTLNPIGAIAGSSARAVQSSIAVFIPLIQSYINKPGSDTSADAIGAIEGVLPIAKVNVSCPF